MLHTKLRDGEPGDFFNRDERYAFMTAKLPPRANEPHRGNGTHAAPVRQTRTRTVCAARPVPALGSASA